MKHFCFFIKTYLGDLDRLKVLLGSIEKNNCDGIDVVVSVPAKEFTEFEGYLSSSRVHLLADEDINTNLFDEITNGFSPGYLNQQIVKLSFWETGMYEYYLCLDSDSQFIRNFKISDFFFDEKTPYSNLYEWEPHFLDRDHLSWAKVYKKNLEDISSAIGLKMSKIITCSGNTILSANVLESFKSNFMIPSAYDYQDLLEICPFEFTWYNLWLIKSNIIRIVPVSGFLKMFHYRKQYEEARRKLLKQEDIAELYVGIVLNSNWSPLKAPYYYKNPGCHHYFIYAIKKISSRLLLLPYKIFINPGIKHYKEKYFK